MECLLIGIGGTGAKIVESCLHLAAAGIGPEKLCVGLVDQDGANGNVDATKSLAKLYRDVRGKLRAADEHRLGASRLLATDVELIDEVWMPVPDGNVEFRKIFDGLGRQERDLFEALFSSRQRTMLLGAGFRGNPALGAAAIEARMCGAADGAGDPFLHRVGATLNAASAGQQVRVCIVGSIFGGTGASGFPTLSRDIRRRVVEVGIAGNVRIGGVLLLPYFRTINPGIADGANQPIMLSERFLEQTQGALRYYKTLWESGSVWDSLYVLGWDPLLNVPAFRMGGKDQANPPLIPELYAASAAHDVFLDQAPAGILRIDRQTRKKLNWSDVPGNSQLRASLGQFLRFAAAFRCIYAPAIKEITGEYQTHPWYRHLVMNHISAMNPEQRRQYVEAISALCGTFLKWIGDMDVSSKSGEEELALVRTELFALHQSDSQNGGLALRSRLEERDLGAFHKIVEPSDGPSLNSIFRKLSNAQAGAQERGLGVFCARLFAECL